MSFLSRALMVGALSGAALAAQTGPRTRNPHGPLPVSCEACHTATAWSPIRPHPEFNHDTQTAYPLRGMHANVACRSCHVNLVFQKVAHDCAACHADLHRRQMGADCALCHTVRGWTPAAQMTAREHSNRFPLLGAHARVECESCHRGAAVAVFTGLSTECVTCHRSDFVSAQNPPHQAGGFPLDCASCHSMNAWLGAKFDHAAIAHFPLDGVHATLPCSACHVGGRFAGTPAACSGCHMDVFRSATNPNHVAAGFSTDCSQCHNTTTWLTAKFDHAGVGFPLTGAHAALECSQCHNGNDFASAPKACAGCHMPDFGKATNPNHAAAGFPTDCSLCHNTVTWTTSTFDHNALSGFPLTGAHTALACSQCHAGNNFAAAPRTCDGCHLTDFNKTTNPNHASAGFPTDCSLCHNTTDWNNAVFDHSKTKFPLTGAHTALPCQQCHTNNQFASTPTNCDACHLAQFNQTTNPNHAQASFPLDCSLCHNTSTWNGAVFDHSKTKFPLTGAHVNTPCASCHVGGNYTTVPTDCYSCHKADYTGVQNPNHIAAGFPTACTQCHNTTTWSGATFTHSRFPIYSGAHNKGVWTTCADCHLDASNYNTFSCTNCHTHTEAATDPIHRNVRGYTYAPTICYQCHPQGRR